VDGHCRLLGRFSRLSRSGSGRLLTLPPPADGRLHLIADKTIKPKSGKKQPFARKTRMDEYSPYIFGLEVVLLIAQWGCFRAPLDCELIDPKRKGHQNILFRKMLRRLQPLAWSREVIVLADAGFASKQNLRSILRTVLKPNGAKNLMNTKRRRDCHIVTRHFSLLRRCLVR
jgi:hypothetical protein